MYGCYGKISLTKNLSSYKEVMSERAIDYTRQIYIRCYYLLFLHTFLSDQIVRQINQLIYSQYFTKHIPRKRYAMIIHNDFEILSINLVITFLLSLNNERK